MATQRKRPAEELQQQPDLLDGIDDQAGAPAQAITRAARPGPESDHGEAIDEVEEADVDVGEYAVMAGGKGVLKKANEAIVMTPVSGDLIFLSRKAFNVLLYHAQQQGLREKNRFSIPYSVLKQDTGFNSENMRQLKDRFRNLIRTTIEWGWIGETLEDAPKRIWSVTALLADAYFEVDPKTRELWLYWSYSETLKQQLLESRQYTKLSLAMMARLRSLPALALYELAARYETSPSKVSKRATWEQWVFILKGKPITEYPTLDYRRFKRETLIPAKAQVNAEQDDYELDWKEFRAGKKVTHLQLVIRPRRKGPGATGPDAALRASMDMGLFNRMLAIGIHQYSADTIYGSCDEQLLRRAIEQVESRIGNKKLPKLNSVEAYLRDRIRWQTEHIGEARATRDAAEAQEGRRESQELERAAGGVGGTDERLALVREEYTRHHLTLAKKMFAEALQPQRDEWVAEFVAARVQGGPVKLREAFERSGMKSSMVSGVFNMWLYETNWNPNPSKMELIDFGLANNFIKVG